MVQCITTGLMQGTTMSAFYNNFNCLSQKSILVIEYKKSCLYGRQSLKFHNYGALSSSSQGSLERVRYAVEISCKAKVLSKEEVFPPIQTLRRFPIQELHSKIVLIRFDSSILLEQKLNRQFSLNSSAYVTIKYVYKAGAKIILMSSWSVQRNTKVISEEAVADFLSSILELKVVAGKNIFLDQPTMAEQFELADIILFKNLSNYKQEIGNSSDFAKRLASGVDIFINDSFSSAHKVLASTVGVTQFCCVCLAGFYFEDSLHKLKKISECNNRPYVAVVGGGKIIEKAAALYILASRCDGLVFVGMMAFQIMHALGLPVPMELVDPQGIKEALELVKIAKDRSMPILLPKDFCCKHEHLPNLMKTLYIEEILDGWQPVDLGPNSFVEIASFLSGCKKAMWIGPLKFVDSDEDADGASKLILILDELSQMGCQMTIVGHMACETVLQFSRSVSTYDMIEPTSVVWEFLKGKILPGLLALDRAYPFEIDWNTVYHDPARPLVVDIGSGNGLFLKGMAKSRKDLNFLGLEMNKKLVISCLNFVHQSELKNLHFIATNATSSFRTIVSSYPGPVELVSIQCPNPDFNQPEHRWRMVQRSLVEAIADELDPGGKVFLQSDVEEVARRMREQFLTEGKQKLVIEDSDNDCNGWLKENPFGVRSDWERHVLARKLPMYRLMFYKTEKVV
ncbi:uncharacterized protein LOC141647657 isoform X2 [Silene latifolia]|uniref:uncharacterized protein LOC141647657 isoform X2 n=1 Tax=Silene latifolia TaxID=37657 RepID=UPI003D77EC25